MSALAIECAVVPQASVPDPNEAKHSRHAVLETCGIRPVRAMQRLSAANVGQVDADRLGVSLGAATLRIERLSFAADGRVVKFTRPFYRGDAYDFVAELNLGAGP